MNCGVFKNYPHQLPFPHVTVPPTFLRVLKDVHIEEDKSVKLEVDVQGNPYPEVEWYKDGQLVLDGEGLQLTHQENHHELEISGTEREDSGLYSVTAHNVAGTEKSEAKVIVGKAPQFKSMKKLFTSSVGDRIKIQTSVTGEPTPQLTWLKNGTVIQNQDRHIITTVNDSTCLEIENCAVEDEGLFTIRAENVFGQDVAETTLEVQGIISH